MAKVTLRQKPMSNKRHSLFLDYYPPILNPETGKLVRKEYLKLFLYDKPKTEFDKLHNKETLYLAENIKAQRQLEVQNAKYGFISDKQRNGDFIEYFKMLASKRRGSNSNNWSSALNYLEKFTGGAVKFSQINLRWCNDFKDFLQSTRTVKSDKATLSTNSCVSYFNKIKHTLKEAYKEGYLSEDVNAKLVSIKPAETSRQYLSFEELQALVNTDCKLPILKKAGIFSALTGMRIPDLKQLRWSDIKFSELEGGYSIPFRQQKTKGVEYLPISKDAINVLGEINDDNNLIFKELSYTSHFVPHLNKWIKDAGIQKHITFHSFRHTFATLQLSYGTDIYTVSKMLGHRDLKTTQIYAKVIDKTKRQASDVIKLKFD
ncbi:MAG: site-specific integrase [Bacteroidetes bacterium]|nr:site-specific integrase [Bacteroidota bacterium]